jgi:ABC-2 type transport system ATP-binding protein
LPGAELVATFGTVLHISGTDGAQLEGGLRAFVQDHALKMSAVPVSLEDVFIHLMQGSEDQFRG